MLTLFISSLNSNMHINYVETIVKKMYEQFFKYDLYSFFLKEKANCYKDQFIKFMLYSL